MKQVYPVFFSNVICKLFYKCLAKYSSETIGLHSVIVLVSKLFCFMYSLSFQLLNLLGIKVQKRVALCTIMKIMEELIAV